MSARWLRLRMLREERIVAADLNCNRPVSVNLNEDLYR